MRIYGSIAGRRCVRGHAGNKNGFRRRWLSGMPRAVIPVSGMKKVDVTRTLHPLLFSVQRGPSAVLSVRRNGHAARRAGRLFLIVCGYTGDIVLACAEGAQAGAVGGDGLVDGADGEGVGLVQSRAVIMRVVDFAERCPVDLLVAQYRFGGCQLLFGDRVPVIAAEPADHQGDDGDGDNDGLGLLVGIFVLQKQDDDGDEADDTDDDAQVVPEPEREFVLFGSGADVVGLFPKLRADDQEDEIQHDETDQLIHRRHEVQGHLARQDQDGAHFAGQRQDPENDGSRAQAAGIADRFGFFNLSFGWFAGNSGLFIHSGTCFRGDKIVFFLFCHGIFSYFHGWYLRKLYNIDSSIAILSTGAGRGDSGKFRDGGAAWRKKCRTWFR